MPVYTDIAEFQVAHAASGLPPVLGDHRETEGFRAGLVAGELGPLRLVELVTPAGECVRDGRCARSTDEHVWQVELMTRGRADIEQGKRVAALEPADLILVDPTRPVRFASTAARHVTLLIPRRELRLPAADVERLVGVRISGSHGPGALVSALARDLARSLAGFRPGEADRSAAAVIELVAVALEARLGEVRPSSEDALRNRIVGFIEARLADRNLAPVGVAAAHHISLRRLHTLFEDQPLTVAALIRRRRLERCRADLLAGDRTVAAVAARWGFADPAHFSRLYKATYGHTASALMSSSRAPAVKAQLVEPDDHGGPGTTEG